MFQFTIIISLHRCNEWLSAKRFKYHQDITKEKGYAMKKIITFLLVLAMAVAVFGGCTKGNMHDDPFNDFANEDNFGDDSSDLNAPNNNDSTGNNDSPINNNTDNNVTNNNDNNDTPGDNSSENAPVLSSEGLEFRIEGDHCVLVGRGTCEDTNIRIPSHYMGLPVTVIGKNAFLNDKLVSIIIPNTVTTLEMCSIRGCMYLENVQIPNSITYVGWGVFWGCHKIPKTEHETGYYFGSEENPYMFLARIKDQDSTEYVIHKDTKFMLSLSCTGLTNMKTIILPEGLISMDNELFGGCKALESIVIPDSVTTIQGSSFVNCTALESITIGKGLIEVSEYAFYAPNLPTIYFNGTMAEWEVVAERIGWYPDMQDMYLSPICTDTVLDEE